MGEWAFGWSLLMASLFFEACLPWAEERLKREASMRKSDICGRLWALVLKPGRSFGLQVLGRPPQSYSRMARMAPVCASRRH